MFNMFARKSLTKKGISRSMIIFLVIMAITLVIFLAFFTPWKKETDYNYKKEMCRNSFLMHAVSAAVGIPLDLACQTNYFTLRYDADKDRDREMIKKQIADLWLDSCYVFGYGKYEIFKEANTYCAVYAVVDFEKKGKTVTGMYDYLLNTNAPGTGQKYVNRCAAYETDPGKMTAEFEKLKSENQIADTIDTSKKYAIIFVYSKDKDIISKFKDYLGGGWKASAELGAGGAVLGYAAAGLIIGSGGTIALTFGAATGMIVAYEIAAGGEPPQWYSVFLIKEYNKETMEKLGCNEFPVVQGYRPE